MSALASFAFARAGVHLLDVGPGDYFGEIALLKDVPRTASVTAVVDSVLYALGRDAFLVAVTGHAASVVLARQVVTERQPEDGGQPLQTGDPASVRRGPTVWCRWSTTETIEGGPVKVTRPGLVGNRYWRRLSHWAASRQPSRSSTRTNSPNFNGGTLFATEDNGSRLSTAGTVRPPAA